MQILSHSILRLLRRPNVAASPAPMHRLITASRHLLSHTASAPPTWWRLPLMAASDPPVHRRVSRFPHRYRNLSSSSGLKGEEESGPLIPSVKDTMISLGEYSQHMKNVENSDTAKEFIARYGHVNPANLEEAVRKTGTDVMYDDGQAPRTTVEVTDGKRETWGKRGDVLMDTNGSNGEIVVSEDKETLSWAEEIPHYSVDWVAPMDIHLYSSHRDGSIYRGKDQWKKDFCVVDRRETRLEAMMLTNPTDDCLMENDVCIHHRPRCMVQIFSLKVAKIPVDAGSVELYGYIAARDHLDPLLNYVVNISRDDPIVVEQGSLISMAPKRGIKLGYETLIEYDMKIKTGGSEKDDLQLIDGVSVIDTPDTSHRRVFTRRINGDCGAIDITVSRLDDAMEATIEVVISEVQGSFDMSLGCFTSKLDKEIQLFDGTIVEPRVLGRSVVAVAMRTQMDLKFKIGSEPSSSSEYRCSFMPYCHGHANELIKTDFASISVKVTWSTLPCRWTTLRPLLEKYGHGK